MEDIEFMKIALEEAQQALLEDEVPVGCVLVCDDIVIAKGHNTRQTNNDIFGHAEINVLKEAQQKLNSWKLKNAVLYVTLEPCPMCAGALQQAGVKRIVYGARDDKMGACGGLFDFFLTPKLNHYPFLTSGVLEKECSDILKEYFQKKRKK